LIQLIDRINSIYRNTEFDSMDTCYTGMGFEIKEILIHEVASGPSDTDFAYNMDLNNGHQWSTSDLLEKFDESQAKADFCLSHLFTFRAFNGVLGLAYVASHSSNQLGGICGRQMSRDMEGSKKFYNTGWSSYQNKLNKLLVTKQAEIVTTHEFGHNWGSPHDPAYTEVDGERSALCAPDEFSGGKFIMWAYSVSGQADNNKVFSECSRYHIGRVLQHKHDLCFVDPELQTHCGDYTVGEGEQCDVGPHIKDDPCCDMTGENKCMFKPGADCSGYNSLCCVGCTMKKANTTVCKQEDPMTCEGVSTCNGINDTCPKPTQYLADGRPCFHGGTCQQGKCVSFCERFSIDRRMPCICDNEEDSCYTCCKNATSSLCQVYMDKDTNIKAPMPDGVPCVKGYCNQNGTCEENAQKVDRWWKLIEILSPSQFVDTMRKNIAGTVLCFSLMAAIPVYMLVKVADKRHQEIEDEKIKWHSRDNTYLFRPGEYRNYSIQRGYKIHKSSRGAS